MFSGFIRKGSRFRGPERTEFQTHNLSRMTMPRRSVQFERKPSQRFSRRASYAIKRKLQEQQKRGMSCTNTSEILNSEKHQASNSHIQPQTFSLAPKSPGISLKSKSTINSMIPSTNENKFHLSFINNNKKPYDENCYDVLKPNDTSDPKCNILKAQLMAHEKKQKLNKQTLCENIQPQSFQNNINSGSANMINSDYSKFIDKKNIFQSFEASNQLMTVKNQPVQRYNSMTGMKQSSISETNQTKFSNLGMIANQRIETNLRTNMTRSCSDSNNQQKPDLNHITKNRNLISFNNNVHIMKINKQHMTEI